MEWKDVAKVIGSAAPIVGGLIGGPAGAGVGTLISQALGVGNSPDAVVNALKTDPDALVKLKQFEMTHKEKLQELQLESVKAYLGDVQNARGRQNAHEKATGETDYNLYILAWTIVAGFFGLIAVMMYVTIPQESNNIIYMLFGTLSAGFGSVMQYFFGSSKGSKEKTILMDKHMEKLSSIKPAEEESY